MQSAHIKPDTSLLYTPHVAAFFSLFFSFFFFFSLTYDNPNGKNKNKTLETTSIFEANLNNLIPSIAISKALLLTLQHTA